MIDDTNAYKRALNDFYGHDRLTVKGLVNRLYGRFGQ